MNEKPKSAQEMVLYAWVGVDDAPPFSGEFGIKAAICPAGWVPMVACKEDRMNQNYIVEQMKDMAKFTGKGRQLVRFKFDKVITTIKP